MPVLNRLSPAEAAGGRERLERTARPCGCKSGALMSLAALVAWPVWIATSAALRTLAGLAQSLVAYAFVVLAAGVIGKLTIRHLVAFAALSAGMLAPAATASAEPDGSSAARAATARFHKLDTARAEG